MQYVVCMFLIHLLSSPLLSLPLFSPLLSYTLLSSSNRCHLAALNSPGTFTKLRTDPLCLLSLAISLSKALLPFCYFSLLPSLPVSVRSNKIYLPYMTSSLQLLEASRLKNVKLFSFFRRIFHPKPTESPPDLIGPINKPFYCKSRLEAEAERWKETHRER